MSTFIIKLGKDLTPKLGFLEKKYHTDIKSYKNYFNLQKYC